MTTEQLYRQSSLWSVFGFDEHALVANRTGQMTKPQRQKLLKQMRNTVLIFVGIVSLFVLVFWIAEKKTPTNDIGCIRAIIILLFGYLGLNTFLRLLFDVCQEKVDKVCGFASLDVRTQYRSFTVQYQLRIRDIDFALNKAQFLAMRHGELYCIYYASNSRYILSIEVQ